MKNKLFRFLLISGIFLVQLILLGMMLQEHYAKSYVFLMIVIAIVGLVLVYWKSPLHLDAWEMENKWVFLVLPISATLTYALNNELGLGPVFSAGIVGLLGSYLYVLNPKSTYLKQIGTPIYCGAFIGMSSFATPYIYLIILVAALFSSLLFYLSKSLFVGVGGKLGTLAFIGVVISMLLVKLILD